MYKYSQLKCLNISKLYSSVQLGSLHSVKMYYRINWPGAAGSHELLQAQAWINIYYNAQCWIQPCQSSHITLDIRKDKLEEGKLSCLSILVCALLAARLALWC